MIYEKLSQCHVTTNNLTTFLYVSQANLDIAETRTCGKILHFDLYSNLENEVNAILISFSPCRKNIARHSKSLPAGSRISGKQEDWGEHRGDLPTFYHCHIQYGHVLHSSLIFYPVNLQHSSNKLDFSRWYTKYSLLI